MAVNTLKLLPQSKSGALALRTSKISVGKKDIDAIKRYLEFTVGKKDKEKGSSLVKSEGGSLANEILKMKSKIIRLQGEFDKNKKFNQKEEESKRKTEEKEKRSKREKQLEKKDGKGLNLPNVISRLPGGNIIDAIKRYLGFTFLGWLVGKYEVLMPQLEKFMSIAKPVFEGLVFATGSILKGVYGFVEAGYKAYDTVSATIKQIGGEDAEKTFNEFSSHLNKLLNGTLMAAMLIASTSPGGKPGRMPGRKPGRTPGGVPKGAKPNQRLQSYLNRNSQTKLIERRYGNEAARMYEARRSQGASAQRALADVKGKFQPLASQGSLGGANRGSGIFKRGLSKAPQRAATKMFGKAAGKTVSKLGGRIPIVGPLIDFGIRTLIYKEPLGKAAAGAVGMGVGQALGGWLGGAIGGIVGSVVPFVGTMLVGAAGATIGSLIGGLIGDMIGAALYDFIAGSSDNKKPTKRASGGSIPPTKPQVREKVRSVPKRNRVQAQKTSPGKDIGGRHKIEQFYGDERIKPNDPTDTRTYGQEIVKRLEKSSQEVKKLPLDWVSSIGGAFIDMTMGQRPDKKLASDVAKSFGNFVDTVLNNEITASTGQISKAIVGMAEGGSVPKNSDEKNQIAKRVESDIERRLQTIFDKASGETFKNLRPDSMMKSAEELREMQERSRVRQDRGGGGGGPSPDYTDISKISMGGFSPDDIDALGRMIAAESGGQPKIGKAAVLSVILNRYRLAKAGDAGYMPSGKNKNTVTLKDILYDEGQFTPIRDGRFDKTSSAAGKNALADAIALSGNDPKKFKEKLMKDLKMSEENAELVVRATAFSNPKTRRVRPFNTPEVSVGDHSFQSSPYSKIGNFPGAISAKVEREAAVINKNLSKKAKFLLVMSGKKGYRQIMPGESVPKDYLHHGHEHIRNGLIVRDYGITPQVHGGSTMLEGEGAPLVVPFGMKAKAIVKGSHEVQFQDKDGNVIAVYHHLENIPPNINGRFISGGTFFGTQGGRPGASSAYGSSTAVHTHLEGTLEWHNAFINTYVRGLDVTKTNLPEAPSITPSSSVSKGDYDIIIPLDHVPAHLANKIPDTKGGNTFKFARQTGADGREREYTGKIASYVSEKLMKQGYRVKIIAPEDFGNFEDYDNYIANQSKKGTTVLPFHLDADPKRGGTGFLARIRKDDIEDARVAESVAPVLKKYAEIFGGGQRFGGIDSVQNATIDRAAAGPAALLELGSLVTLERMFGKNFVNHPQYTAFLDELTGSISQTVAKKQPPIKKGQVATLNKKPVTWDGKKWVPKEQYDNTQGWKAAAKRSAQIQADRPWWDKLGFFGGAAAEKQRREKAAFESKNSGATLYNKPTRKQGGGTTLSSNQPKSSYSSLNRSGVLREDTSLNKEMVIMYQKEVIMT